MEALFLLQLLVQIQELSFGCVHSGRAGQEEMLHVLRLE